MDPPRHDIPDTWENDVEAMETTATDTPSMEEKIRQATLVVTSAASDPTSYDENVVLAARAFLAAAGVGGSSQ